MEGHPRRLVVRLLPVASAVEEGKEGVGVWRRRRRSAAVAAAAADHYPRLQKLRQLR